MTAHPIREPVPGAPFQPGDLIRVVQAVDPEIHDVGEWVGRTGLVDYLEYECGAGQTYPGDPMIGVKFSEPATEEFWPEELEAVS